MTYFILNSFETLHIHLCIPVPGVLQQCLERRPLQDVEHHHVGQQRDGLRQLRLQRHGLRRRWAHRREQPSDAVDK